VVALTESTVVGSALKIAHFSRLEAEGEGFEPSDDVTAANGFRDEGG
jgi:hypothetical protein